MPTDLDETQICRAIKAARITAGFDTQEQAAIALGVPLPTYRRFESGKVPRLPLLVEMCHTFRTTPNALLGF